MREHARHEGERLDGASSTPGRTTLGLPERWAARPLLLAGLGLATGIVAHLILGKAQIYHNSLALQIALLMRRHVFAAGMTRLHARAAIVVGFGPLRGADRRCRRRDRVVERRAQRLERPMAGGCSACCSRGDRGAAVPGGAGRRRRRASPMPRSTTMPGPMWFCGSPAGCSSRSSSCMAWLLAGLFGLIKIDFLSGAAARRTGSSAR
jgi:hypothetical protein